jgi:hypothetical protein
VHIWDTAHGESVNCRGQRGLELKVVSSEN